MQPLAPTPHTAAALEGEAAAAGLLGEVQGSAVAAVQGSAAAALLDASAAVLYLVTNFLTNVLNVVLAIVVLVHINC